MRVLQAGPGSSADAACAAAAARERRPGSARGGAGSHRARTTGGGSALLRADAAERLAFLLLLACAVLPQAASAQVQEICLGSPVPSGLIEINLRWSATECGPGTPSNPNKLIVERYDDKPPGHVMAVCAWADTPAGWVELDRRWLATNRCIANSSPSNPNAKYIRRLQ